MKANCQFSEGLSLTIEIIVLPVPLNQLSTVIMNWLHYLEWWYNTV